MSHQHTVLGAAMAALIWACALTPAVAAMDAAVCASDAVQENLRIEVQVQGLVDARGLLRADGQTRVPLRVQLRDACGDLLHGMQTVQIQAGGLRLLQLDRSALASLANAEDAHVSGDIWRVSNGELALLMVAPSSAQDIELVVRAGKQVARSPIGFAPDLRPMIATGLIDGVFSLGRKDSNGLVPSAGMGDGFDAELTRFQRDFDDGNMALAGRTAFFVKGMVRGDTLLTAAFDSEKPNRQRVLADIRPDQYYPVMGDSSTKGSEARSSDRLYVRLDNGRNYLLYGDFATGDGFSQQLGGASVGNLQQRNLGQYNRSMTGVRGHWENSAGFVDAFAMNDALRQAVEEYRGNGTSGPYAIANLNAVENSDKLEIIVRDRNNVARILSQTLLTRFVDYTFEPFSGRILLKAPLASLDDNLNPVSLRITYEVDTLGDTFWVAGVATQRKLSDAFELGGSVMHDDNPARPSGTSYGNLPGQGLRELRSLTSINAGWQTGPQSKWVAEFAQSISATADVDATGNAYRVEYVGQGQGDGRAVAGAQPNYTLRGFAGVSDTDFNNPAASYTAGHSEAGVRGDAELNPTTHVLGEALRSEDALAHSSRSAFSTRLEHALSDKLLLDAGLRHVHQTEGAVLSFSNASSNLNLPGQGSVFSGAGLNPNGAGFWGAGSGLNPVSGQPQSMLNGQVIPGAAASPALDAWTVRSGLRYRTSPSLTLGVEMGQDIGLDGDPVWAAASVRYHVSGWSAFARAETPTGRTSAGGDYRLTETVSLYGRMENTNGLASSYALDSAAQSQALVVGIKQSDGQGLENFSELRLNDAMSGEDAESATGLRNTFLLQAGLKVNFAAERLVILSGGNRGASALAGGVEWSRDVWRSATRLEWRQLDPTPGALINDTTSSWLLTQDVARKIDADWTALLKNYALITDNQAIDGTQSQLRVQLGAAYRPVEHNRFDALLTYAHKVQVNQEIDPAERSIADVLASNLNWHPRTRWWLASRVAAKNVDENLAGVADTYQAALVSGRLTHDLTADWDVGVAASNMFSSQGTQQYAYGVEGGYLVARNAWVSLGYNFSGFSDPDLTGSDYTRQGPYLRLRVKFDEKLFDRSPNTKARFQE